MEEVCVVIPARYESSRFPGKPLADILGKSMIHRVYDQVRQCRLVNRIIVATDDQRIFEEVSSFGGEVVLTSKDAPNGTLRIIEAAGLLNQECIIINVQGDEPIINPRQIDDLIQNIKFHNCDIATQCIKIIDEVELFDFKIVKVVRDVRGRAMYFSRQVIPAYRDLPFKEWIKRTNYFRHVGIYAFNLHILKKIETLPPGIIENIEMLEQLGWMENGISVYCFETDYRSIAVDTPEDIDKVVEYLIKKEIGPDFE